MNLRSSVPLALALAAGGVVFTPCGAQNTTPPPAGKPQVRLLVDRELNHHPVTGLTLDAETARFRDAEGHAASLPLAGLLAVLPPEPAPAASTDAGRMVWREISDVRTDSGGRLELTDGELFPGRLDRAPVPADSMAHAGAEEAVAWECGLLGRMTVPLERISLAVLRGDKATAGTLPAASPAGDVIGLTNKDRVQGFVESVAGRVKAEVSGKPAEFPAERVAFIRFANPAGAASGARVWLSDATVASVDSLRVGADKADLGLSGVGTAAKTISIPQSELAAVSFDITRLRPLASLTLVPARSAEDRVYTPAPVVRDPASAPLGASDIELPGPMSVEWTLPAGASRLAGSAELPPACRAWGDCVLIIASGEAELLRQRINGEHAAADFNLALPPGAARLRVTIDEGEGGPIQDRVTLKRTLVLVGK